MTRPESGPFGPLKAVDGNGVALPEGFTCRIVGRSGERVGGVTWHAAPAGGACFPDGDGWIYVSNSDVPLVGGVSGVRFEPDGTVGTGYRILSGTDHNRAGAATPWHTWLSCEAIRLGRVFECDPYGYRAGLPRLAMGRFRHGGVAIDPDREVVYLIEDEPDGCLYRFRPEDWGDLTTGTLEVLAGPPGEQVAIWKPVRNPGATSVPAREQVEGARRFDGAQDCHYADGFCYFTTRGDGRVYAYDAVNERVTVLYDGGARSYGYDQDAQPYEYDGGAMSTPGNLFVAEDDGVMEINVITRDGAVSPFLRVEGHEGSRITGPAFSPDGGRLYFSSRRGGTQQAGSTSPRGSTNPGGGGSTGAGITYEVSGPFRG
ncbi:PhoX family protein [Planotetraspora sp. A-T 1434]|uniref:PhoX family protein n=1 Tax=Planotetraspora sp. A-T 1434 TaxID=2979219 RepID=UPI0021BF13FB|nr:PhoX family protein [Planotetraspora sp. A-T 1434]MCT9930148.1 PhoX family protein [Planotetraspora sp. A-T 1434]